MRGGKGEEGSGAVATVGARLEWAFGENGAKSRSDFQRPLAR